MTWRTWENSETICAFLRGFSKELCLNGFRKTTWNLHFYSFQVDAVAQVQAVVVWLLSCDCCNHGFTGITQPCMVVAWALTIEILDKNAQMDCHFFPWCFDQGSSHIPVWQEVFILGATSGLLLAKKSTDIIIWGLSALGFLHSSGSLRSKWNPGETMFAGRAKWGKFIMTNDIFRKLQQKI